MSILARERTVAPANYNRWLVPPAALAVHCCIGQVYGFSVFNLPLSKLPPGDWSLSLLGLVFELAIVFLGLSAALFGKWVERVGPRQTMFVAGCCFGSGFLVGALGILWHQIALLYLGYGVLGGIGLGLGYIAPVSTLVKWFPDRPGMATGLAIMGFGAGAMIGSPLGVQLMQTFGASAVGIAKTFAVMGVVYFCFIQFGAWIVRLPAPGWRPAGSTPPAAPAPGSAPESGRQGMVTTAQVSAAEAIKTPQFWLLWGVLCLNVTAGIGVLGQASPMIQEMFPKVVDPHGELVSKGITAAAAAGFVGLLSLFNMLGRFFWSSVSDLTGRKRIYMVYFALGTVLYGLVPVVGRMGNVTLFVVFFAVIISMYGAGFATIPAYLRDLFGTYQVGAIHGRLLTAWSVAGVVGPSLVNLLREYQLKRGTPSTEAYSVTMDIMAGLLVLGFVCNLLVRPVAARHALASQPGTPDDASVLPAARERAGVR